MLNKAQDGIVEATTAVKNLCDAIVRGIATQGADRLRELEGLLAMAQTEGKETLDAAENLLNGVRESVVALCDRYKVYSHGVRIAGEVTIRKKGLGESEVAPNLTITPLEEEA